VGGEGEGALMDTSIADGAGGDELAGGEVPQDGDTADVTISGDRSAMFSIDDDVVDAPAPAAAPFVPEDPCSVPEDAPAAEGQADGGEDHTAVPDASRDLDLGLAPEVDTSLSEANEAPPIAAPAPAPAPAVESEDVREARLLEEDAEGHHVAIVVHEDNIAVPDRINFEPNTAVLLPAARRVLNSVARVLLAHPLITHVEVAGHCSDSGSSAADDAREQIISEERAAAVSAYLVSRGVEPSRLLSRGYGDKRPIATNATAEGRALNRRVEFVILHRRGEGDLDPATIHADDDEHGDVDGHVSVTEDRLEVPAKIKFEPNTAVLAPSAHRTLNIVARTLAAHPLVSLVEIAGHCSLSGTGKDDEEKEQKISEDRAIAVVQYLVQHGVEESRLIARGYGGSKPIATNKTADGRSANRRVEFVILRRAGQHE
jgi:OOP family OmpA-OmpF porin